MGTLKAFCMLVFAGCMVLQAQTKRIEAPLGEALNKALKKDYLMGQNALPFHLHMTVSEPGNPQSAYQGTVEVWWVSDSQWRQEVQSKDGFHQAIVMSEGQRSEHDEGTYYPLWLRNFVFSITDPVPNADMWNASGAKIEQTVQPNGAKSPACARESFQVGSGAGETDAFANLCLDPQGRLQFVGSPRYSMTFAKYEKFGKKEVAREIDEEPEPGTKLVGIVDQLEWDDGSTNATVFASVGATDHLFEAVEATTSQLEDLSADNPPLAWPPAPSGNTQEHLAIYLSADNKGVVREVWPLNSDNAGLADAVRDQILHWKLKPARDASGNYVQVDGALGFPFGASAEAASSQAGR